MKSKFYILFAIIGTLLLPYKSSLAQKKDPIRVKIEWVSFVTESIIRVECGQFRNSFGSHDEVKIFNDKAHLLKFGELLRSSIDSKTELSFDTRGEVTFYYEHSQVRYCFDPKGQIIQDGQMVQNKELIKYIFRAILSKEEADYYINSIVQ